MKVILSKQEVKDAIQYYLINKLDIFPADTYLNYSNHTVITVEYYAEVKVKEEKVIKK